MSRGTLPIGLAPFLLLWIVPSTAAATARAEHVVVIGMDGLTPEGIVKAEVPNIRKLMARGAHTLHARAVMPTVSSPNWASILMGAGPEQHGVTSNDWEPNKFDIAPTAVGSGGIFPTIFDVVRSQRPSAHLAVFHDWRGFSQLFERRTVNVIGSPEDGKRRGDLPATASDSALMTTLMAADGVKKHKPTLTFVHLDLVDAAGHASGYNTAPYFTVVTEADRYVGQILQAVAEAGMLEKTAVLVVSDHGGKDKDHGGNTMQEIEVPWIIAGPGIVEGKTLTLPVDVMQTAPTIAHLLGVQPHPAWIARPVLEAFTNPPSSAPIRTDTSGRRWPAASTRPR